jgi:hypothetical protein
MIQLLMFFLLLFSQYRSISADLAVDTTSTTSAGTAAVSAAPVQPTVITATGVTAYDGGKKGDLKGTTAVKSSGRVTPTASGKVGGKQWVPCAVCGLDVTWPYVLHSDASRAIVAHNCRYEHQFSACHLSVRTKYCLPL